MLRAEVRGFHSPDIDLDDPSPDELDQDAFLLQIFVGRHDTEGEDTFDVLVSTPTHLAELLREEGPRFGRHMLLVEQIHIPTIEKFLSEYIAQLSAPSWEGLARLIGRIAKWEFEDYRELPDQASPRSGTC